MFSDSERNNLSDTIKEIEEYPWSIKSVTVKGVKYTAPEFIKLAIKYKTGKDLADFLDVNPSTIRRKLDLFKELPNTGEIIRNKFLSVLKLKHCNNCNKVLNKENFYKSNSYLCKMCSNEISQTLLLNNTERYKKSKETWKLKNSDKMKGYQAKYQAAKLQRMPKWADGYEIGLIYANCPKGHHVDHIIPLQGELVSGLHVPENLQYLPAKENLSKGNKFDPQKNSS